MTYCVAMLLDSGLVFLSDSRTNAGVDQVSTFRKTTVVERPGDRVIVLLASGNLAVTQGVLSLLAERVAAPLPGEPGLLDCRDMFEVSRCVGAALREMHARDGEALRAQGHEFNANFVVGGQVRGEAPRLFHVYAAGNFVEATKDTTYFQIGESKYGKPIIDRVIKRTTSLVDATKCTMVSFDSTMRSNISVGLPIDLLVYETDTLRIKLSRRIEETDPYFQMVHTQWGEGLRRVFAQLPDPDWT